MLEIRNLPFAYSFDDVLQEWPVDGTWNFLAVPYNEAQNRMVGYAVMNFTSPERAQEFTDWWHGFFLWTRSDTGESLDIKAIKMTWRSYLASLRGSVQHLFLAGHLPKVVENGRLWSDWRVVEEICISGAIEDYITGAGDVPWRHEAAPDPRFVPWPRLHPAAGAV